MLIPVRCFTCGKVLGDTWERFVLLEQQLRRKKGDRIRKDAEAMTQLHITRYCCRRMLLTHVDLLTKILRCGVQNGAEERAARTAFWVDWDREREREEDLAWLKEKRAKERAEEEAEEGG